MDIKAIYGHNPAFLAPREVQTRLIMFISKEYMNAEAQGRVAPCSSLGLLGATNTSVCELTHRFPDQDDGEG